MAIVPHVVLHPIFIAPCENFQNLVQFFLSWYCLIFVIFVVYKPFVPGSQIIRMPGSLSGELWSQEKEKAGTSGQRSDLSPVCAENVHAYAPVGRFPEAPQMSVLNGGQLEAFLE